MTNANDTIAILGGTGDQGLGLALRFCQKGRRVLIGSRKAERAIEAAEAWMRGDSAALPEDLASKEAIHEELQRVLPGNDHFWPRWVVTYEKAGGKA